MTLSPVPDLTRWIHSTATNGSSQALELVALLEDDTWLDAGSPDADRHQALLTSLAAVYLVNSRRDDGAPSDPVARFHLGNGARLVQLNPRANLTDVGIGRSAGLMVNYRYDLDEIVDNHEAYARGEIRTSAEVDAVLRRGHN